MDYRHYNLDKRRRFMRYYWHDFVILWFLIYTNISSILGDVVVKNISDFNLKLGYSSFTSKMYIELETFRDRRKYKMFKEFPNIFRVFLAFILFFRFLLSQQNQFYLFNIILVFYFDYLTFLIYFYLCFLSFD